MRPVHYFAAVWLTALIAAPVLAQTTSPSKSPSPPATTAPNATGAPQTPAGPREQGGLADINAAFADELDKLPGVGPARAKAIISHRPYNGKDDLVQRKIIPRNVYDQIKDKIIARQGTAQAPSGSAGSPSAAAKRK
jgi:competence protein ComEA